MFDSYGRYELSIRPLGRNIKADEYHHEGSVWIEGREGSTYTIDLKNNTPNRALFVVSVDGLDVLEGKPAGLTSKGYILNGYQSISVPGWKLNDNEAAEFYFSRTQESYVSKIGGSTANTGVIGAMIFSEKVVPIAYAASACISATPLWANNSTSKGILRSANIVGSGLQGMQHSATTDSFTSQDVGTGFGDKTEWKTISAQFEKSNPSQPDQILALYYNTAKNLEKMGIKLKSRRDVSYKANPFPTYTNGCKPPTDWQK